MFGGGLQGLVGWWMVASGLSNNVFVAPERLVFTWQREDEAGLRSQLNNVVTVTFADHHGKTRLTLHHAVFQTVADRTDHQGGWTECLARLLSFVTPG